MYGDISGILFLISQWIITDFFFALSIDNKDQEKKTLMAVDI